MWNQVGLFPSSFLVELKIKQDREQSKEMDINRENLGFTQFLLLFIESGSHQEVLDTDLSAERMVFHSRTKRTEKQIKWATL